MRSGRQPTLATIAVEPGSNRNDPLEIAHGELETRAAHGAAATILAQGVRFVLQFGSQVVLARLLLPGAFGLVAMAAPIVGFLQMFAEMGLLQATVQKPSLSHRELSGLFWINLAVSGTLALLVIACSPALAWFYGEPRVAPVAACLGALLIVGGVSAQPMAVMNRTMRFLPLAAIDILAAAAAAGIGIGSAMHGFGYWSLVLMQSANALTIAAVAWTFAGWKPSRPQRVPELVSLLHFGSQITAYNVLQYVTYNVDSVLIGAALGEIPLGLYNRATRLMSAPALQLLIPFGRVAVPLLSRLDGHPEEYRAAYTRLLRSVLLAAAPAILFAIVMAQPLVVGVLGERWQPAVPIFAWVGVSALAAPIAVSANWLFISQNRPRQMLGWSFAESCIVLLSFAVGLPWGVVGIAAATACFIWLLHLPLLCWAVTRQGAVHLGALWKVIYPAGLASAGSLLAVWLIRPWVVAPHEVLGLAIALLLSYVAHATALGGLPEGRKTLRDAWSLCAALARHQKI